MHAYSPQLMMTNCCTVVISHSLISIVNISYAYTMHTVLYVCAVHMYDHARVPSMYWYTQTNGIQISFPKQNKTKTKKLWNTHTK